LRIFHRNPAIQVVILADTALASLQDALAPVVAQIQRQQPAAVLVGTSATDRRADFAALGVPYFLRQPWRAATLLALLAPERGDQTW
jgi:hypothetical protein